MGKGLCLCQHRTIDWTCLCYIATTKKEQEDWNCQPISPWATHPALSAWYYCYPPHTHQAWCSRGCLGSGRGACWIQLSAPRGSEEGLRMGVFPENIIDPHCSFVTHSFKVTFSFWGGNLLYEWFIYWSTQSYCHLYFEETWDGDLVFWCPFGKRMFMCLPHMFQNMRLQCLFYVLSPFKGCQYLLDLLFALLSIKVSLSLMHTSPCIDMIYFYGFTYARPLMTTEWLMLVSLLLQNLFVLKQSLHQVSLNKMKYHKKYL